jgi:hypothetical protein
MAFLILTAAKTTMQHNRLLSTTEHPRQNSGNDSKALILMDDLESSHDDQFRVKRGTWHIQILFLAEL